MWGAVVYGKPLHVLLNFSVNLKLPENGRRGREVETERLAEGWGTCVEHREAG